MNLCVQASTDYCNLGKEFFGHFYRGNHLKVICTVGALSNPTIY